jgi:hypothetical protein
MEMRTARLQTLGARLVGLIGILALALTATASVLATTTTKKFTFDHEVTIGGTKVAGGDYSLVVDDAQVTVKRGNKVIVQAPAHWETRDAKPDSNSILYGTGNQVVEIRFAHQSEVLVIATP